MSKRNKIIVQILLGIAVLLIVFYRQLGGDSIIYWANVPILFSIAIVRYSNQPEDKNNKEKKRDSAEVNEVH